MTHQELADRLAIQDLLSRYCYALDDRDWITFRHLFTADARLDFSALGGPCTDVEGLIAFLEPILANAPRYQHTVSTLLLHFDAADQVSSRCAGLVPMGFTNEQGNTGLALTGLWYHDRLVRADHGWRFQERVQVPAWNHTLLSEAGINPPS